MEENKELEQTLAENARLKKELEFFTGNLVGKYFFVSKDAFAEVRPPLVCIACASLVALVEQKDSGFQL